MGTSQNGTLFPVEPYRPWSKVVPYKVNKVPIGTQANIECLLVRTVTWHCFFRFNPALFISLTQTETATSGLSVGRVPPYQKNNNDNKNRRDQRNGQNRPRNPTTPLCTAPTVG